MIEGAARGGRPERGGGPDDGEQPEGGGGADGGERPIRTTGPDRRKLLIAVAALLLVVLVDVILLTRGSGRETETMVDRPDLRAETMIGCYVLRAGPWSFTFPSGGTEGEAVARPDTLPARLEPPARVMLLPDSADLHGRDLPSFRAEAIPADTGSERILRWTVRADTLWLVWSEPGSRAGLALFVEGDSLVGWARGVADSIDAGAPAVAWPINCSTLGRERPGEVPRR